MTDGLFKKLSLEQQSAALAFDGNPDFGPPRTDLTKALSELRRLKLGDEIDAEFGSTILDAARTGDLLPRADADLAVALMVEKACHVLDTAGDSAVTEALGQRLCCSGHDCGCRGADVGTYLMHLIRSEVVPASALAELQVLRDSDAESKGNLAHALHQLGQAKAELAALRAQVEKMTGDTFYIDCEFDGHNGPLLSIAMVRGDGRGLHVKIGDHNAVNDPWVRENVIPIMDSHHADLSWHVQPNEAGTQLRGFIGDCQNPKIIADSPVDIARFCRAISTAEDGGWHSSGYASMTLIVRNVDCYPTKLEGAVQHNAWWDAMALRALLAELEAKA